MTTINDSPKPPEWWTAENTEAWHREVWGDEGTWGAGMQTWGSKIRGRSTQGWCGVLSATHREGISGDAGQ